MFALATVFVCSLIAALIYLPGANGGLTLDDMSNLAPVLEYGAGLRSASSVIFDNHSGSFGRPLSLATFALNAHYSGAQVSYFKLTNIALHLCCGFVIFAFLRRLLCVALDDVDKATRLAAITTCLWLVHPFNVSTVLYVVQRMTQLSSLFVFLTLYLYLLARTSTRLSVHFRAIVFVMALASFISGALAKENAVLVFPLILVIEWTVLRNHSSRTTSSPHPYLTIVTLAFALISISAVALKSGYFLNYGGRDFSLQERLLTQSRAMVYYLQSILVPDIRSMSVFQDGFPVSRSLFSPPETIFAVIGVTTSVALVLMLGYRRQFSVVVFGVAFFFSGHLLESTIFPLEMVFDHRNYLASVGMLLVMAALLLRVGEMPGLRSLRFALPVLLIATFAALTLARASIWSTPGSLLLYSVTHKPDSSRAAGAAAMYFAEQGDKAMALHYLEASQRHSPASETAKSLWRVLVYCRLPNGVTQRQFDAIAVAAKEKPSRFFDVDNAFGQVAALLRQNKCNFGRTSQLANLWPAISAHISATGIGGQSARISQTYLLLANKRFDEALIVAREADAALPSRADAAILEAEVLFLLGRTNEASLKLTEIRKRIPQNRPDLLLYMDRLVARQQKL